jgi:oxygen-dependent protoporphyrinogen oxidase
MNDGIHDAIVVGGGVGGLATAWQQRRAGRRVALIEAADRLGGVVRTTVEDGCILEHGPDSLVSIKPGGLELVAALGLTDRLVGVPETARRSCIARAGRLLPVPDGLYLLAPGRILPFVRSPLLSWAGKLRMGADLVLPARRPDAPEESLAAFVRRRLGREALDWIAQPMVSGIYTADPERLSLDATMPQFLAMEREQRSLLLAMMARVRQQRAAAAGATGASGPRYGLFLSLVGGLQTLVDALVAGLAGSEIALSSPVSAVERTADGWWVRAGARSWQTRQLVLALPAHAAASLLAASVPELAADLAGIPYAGVATVNLAFPADRCPAIPAMAGFVIPAREGRSTIACTIADAKYPDRAPAGVRLLRAFVGGAQHAAALEADDAMLAARTLADLRTYLGALPDPTLVRVHRWPRAMAQYHLGHRARVARIRAATAAQPGLHLVGNGYEGVGIPDIAAQAATVAQAIDAGRRTQDAGRPCI